MKLGDLFPLAKLTIRAYAEATRTGTEQAIIEAQYNPDSLQAKHETVFQPEKAAVGSSGQSNYAYRRSADLSIKLVFDGTYVSYLGFERLKHIPTVRERIDELVNNCCQVLPSSNEPAFLKLQWGNGVLSPSTEGRLNGFDCRLRSVDIKYTAFERDGSPLRAELDCIFTQDTEAEVKTRLLGLSSPHLLTQRRVVASGDTLTSLSKKVYGSAEHHLKVAEFNGLDEIRVLAPGQELFFPPLGSSKPSGPV